MDEEHLRVCFVFREKRPRNTTLDEFTEMVKVLAHSLGTPDWDQGELPQIRYGPRVGFVTFSGNLDKVRTSLGQEPDGLQVLDLPDSMSSCRGTWSIAIAKEATAKVTNPFLVSTDHAEVFTENAEAALTCQARVVAAGLSNPGNLGSIYRLMSCFGVGELDHVYHCAAGAEPPLWDDVHRSAKITSFSVGCEKHVKRNLISTDDMIKYLADAADTRPPVVAIETAMGAHSIHKFGFPQRCAIMVGSEGNSIDPRICAQFRDGYDAFVIIPMVGHHTSLNVATALGIALYEYRKQWPPESDTPDDADVSLASELCAT